MSTTLSNAEAEKTGPESYQKYVEELIDDLEKSYTIVRRQTLPWYAFAILLVALGFVVLSFTILTLFPGNLLSLVTWVAGGISLIFIGIVTYRQARDPQMDSYYLGKIQEAKRLSRSIQLFTEIKTDEKTKDELNKLITQRIFAVLTQEQTVLEQIGKAPIESRSTKPVRTGTSSGLPNSASSIEI